LISVEESAVLGTLLKSEEEEFCSRGRKSRRNSCAKAFLCSFGLLGLLCWGLIASLILYGF